jgi:hypothetical protein
MAEPITRAELARCCSDIFEDDRRGQRIIEYLIARWSRTAKKTGGIDSLMDTIRCAAYREVLDDLILLVNQGRDGTAPVEPGDDG